MLTLIVKSIDAVYARAFVIASQHEEVFWVFDLVGQHQADGLDRLLSSVDVVTKEEIVGLPWESSVLEEFD